MILQRVEYSMTSKIFISILLLFSILARAKEIPSEFVGKRWAELPATKYPGFTLPLTWPAEKKLALRYYQPDFERYVITITETVDLKDPSKDIIVTALDLRSLLKGYDGKILQSPSSDCESKEVAGKDVLVIGLISQNRDKPRKTYKPSRAWKIEPKNMEFKEIKAAKVLCEPKNYAE